jgi:hypothetical protein
VQLHEVLEGLKVQGYQHRKGADQPAQQLLRQARQELPEALPVGLRVLASGRAQSLPIVPWLAVIDPDVTTTAHRGIYVVYLWSADLSDVYLTVNQGVTAIEEHFRETLGYARTDARRAALEKLHGETLTIREAVPADALAGVTQPIDLGSAAFLPLAYSEGAIAVKRYQVEELPNEASLWQDLQRFLGLYQQSVAAQRRFNDEHPGALLSGGQSAGKTKPVSTADQATFKPKSASDYVANVPQQSARKTRRHEDLINKFAAYLESNGVKPITRHPRDIEGVTGKGIVLFEGKVVGPNAEHAVRAAIGQLLAYRHFFFREQGEPDPDLIGLFTEPIGEAFVELLNSLEIGAVWREQGSWRGCPIAIKAGIVSAP